MIYYVIPDIHGRKDLLDYALSEIYSRQESGTIIFLGDYIDRGPDSGGVVRLLMSPPPDGWKHICLKGNHEDMLIDDVTNNRKIYDPTILASFGGKITEDLVSWMDSLPHYHIVDDNIFVHADWDEYTIPERQQTAVMMWRRRNPKFGFGNPEKYLTHGHTPHEDGPIFTPNRCNLDCKAFSTGRLCVGVYQHGKKGPIEIINITKEQSNV